MNSEILLTRKIKIETWHIKGSIAKAQERKDMMLVLKFLAESPNSRARDFTSELLFVGDDNPRQVVAQRMLALSKLYGLTADEEPRSGVYSLTDKGKEALEAKEVFVPEYGCWELSVSNDPLLPHSLIQIAPFKEPSAFSESIGKDAKSELEERKKNMKPLPPWTPWIRQVTKLGELSPHVGGKKLRIDSIEDKGEEASPKQSITLEWTVSKNSIRLSDNKLPDNNKKILNQFEGPGLDWNDVWEILLHNEDRLNDWNSSTGKLAMAFEEVPKDARQLMRNDFKFESPKIFANGTDYGTDYGVFDDIVVENIDICAATQADAEEWSEWRLRESINSYASIAKYQQWVTEALAPFGEFGINLPERDEYAAKIWRESDGQTKQNRIRAWHLIAASDWTL